MLTLLTLIIQVNQLSTQTSEINAKQHSILEKYEYPFLTLQQYPIGFIKSVCGIVCARSVKLHTSTTTTQQTSENNFGNNLRDKWFIEIRNEIRTQMKSLECNIVLGYTETKSICEDVCIISAMGTACICDETFFQHYEANMNSDEFFKLFDEPSIKNCSICHILTSSNTITDESQMNLNQDDKQEDKQTNDLQHDMCGVCSSASVPDVLFLTIQPLPELQTNGDGCLLKAVVSRPRKKCSGELSAKIISDCLPFMEYVLIGLNIHLDEIFLHFICVLLILSRYEMHKQLLNKLKLNGT
jgi:hypothetical protein